MSFKVAHLVGILVGQNVENITTGDTFQMNTFDPIVQPWI